MAPWIVFLHLVLPPLAPSVAEPNPGLAEDLHGPRYPGVEQLFARFDAEHAAAEAAAQKR